MSPWLVSIASVLMTVPLLLGSFSGIEFNLAEVLLPIAAFAIISSLQDKLSIAFLASGICGLISIAVANYLSPGNVIGNLSELVLWTLAAPSFVFVGRLLPLKNVVYWGAISSAVFLILVTLPLLLTGEPVRAMYLFDTPGKQPGSEFINIHLLGLPIFATYGVNSIAPLFCIQAALLCGAIASTRTWLRALFAFGLACAVFLVAGSNSRSAQGTMGLLAVASFAYCAWKRDRGTILIITLSATVALLISATRDVSQNMHGIGDQRASQSRLFGTIGGVLNLFGHEREADDESKIIRSRQGLNEISTGRLEIWGVVVSDLLKSPVVGNGFSGFGRFTRPPVETGGNTTAHFYYLNILWKGGILFLIPFASFVLIALRRARHSWDGSPQYFFAATGVILTAALPSLTWDILIVPSAGALAWFLLGALGGNRKRGDQN